MDSKLSYLRCSQAHGCEAYKFEDNLDERVFEYAFLSRSFDVSNQRNQIWVELPDKTQVFTARQVHGINLIPVGNDRQEADGILVSQGQTAGVLTADCTPLILISESHRVGYIIHCGWKSTFGRIVESALIHLSDLGVRSDELLCLIGPAAQKCCYEVQNDFIKKAKEIVNFGRLTSPYDCIYEKNGLYTVSVPEIVHSQLLGKGVLASHIHRSLDCTICNPRFFSHRREKGNAGRQISILRIF